jgi:hypothetical protein
MQCHGGWHYALDPSIDRATGHTGQWKEDKVIKLEDAVQSHGDKDWVAIDKLVPGRTKEQCRDRWRYALDSSIDRAPGCAGQWTEDDVIKLKDAGQSHGDKNWVAIAKLVPGRTNRQCRRKWEDALDPNIDRAPGRRNQWTEDDDIKLKDSIQTYRVKN